jgi:hypothetical protein
MTTGEHTPTEQETALYEALTEGDHDTIADMREDAYSAPPDPDREADELTPAEQYDLDYQNAWTHYQADHEAPEDEREEQTADEVQDENQEAASL